MNDARPSPRRSRQPAPSAGPYDPREQRTPGIRGHRAAALLALLIALVAPFGARAEARVVNGEPIRLLTDYGLSPDGSTLVLSWSGDLWTAPTAGGAATRITTDAASDYNPRYSPNGAEIAFVSSRTGSRQIFVMPATGGPPEQITHHTEGYALDQWHPDGQRLLTRGNRDHYHRSGTRYFLVRRDRRSADELLFDAYASAANLSPSGDKVLFCREGVPTWRKGYSGSQASQIWLADRKSGEFRVLHNDERGNREPLWKPDGSGYYFVSQRDGTFNLYERDLDGDRTRQLTRFEDDGVQYPTISADGKTLVFRQLFDLYSLRIGEEAPPRRIDLWNTGDPITEATMRRTLTSASEATFTDDGLETAFISGGDLWVMDTELKEPVRVTDSAADESDPVFLPDASAILFISRQKGQCDIWRVERSDPDRYWWQSSEFVFKRLTEDAAQENGLTLSPAADRVAFIRGRGDLMTMGVDGKDVTRVLPSWNRPDFEWSPDGKWFVLALEDGDYNSDIYVLPSDGSGELFNLSMHPDNERSPRWSPDGKLIAFTGRRSHEETDVYYIWMQRDASEETSRDRTMEKALSKMTKERKPAKKAEEPAKGDAKDKDKDKDKPDEADAPEEKKEGEDAKEAVAKDAAKKEKKSDLPEFTIDFDGIHDRIGRISIGDYSESGLQWLEKDKLAFRSEVGGKAGFYSVTFPDSLNPNYIGSSLVSGPYLKKAKQFAGTSSGKPALMTNAAKTTDFAFSARQDLDPRERQRAGFEEAWRQMRDDFYDPRLNNRNWDEVRRKYSDAAATAVDSSAFGQVIDMMLGELNGSHLGFSSFGNRGGRGDPSEWTETTVHLGLRYDPDHPGPGWKVKEVFKNGPADKANAPVRIGEIILSVDGQSVDPAMDPTLVLNGDLNRDVRLRVRNVEGEERDATIRPTSFGRVQSLLYDRWIDHNRDTTDARSDGTLGYLHIRSMSWPEFLQFEEALYRVGYGKDGLIIDVRDNGGGSTTDHLLTALTQPVHAVTVARDGVPGYPQDRKVYATWNKPIVVLCNQNSFSNAEIFPHAIKTLGRGKIIGVPTAGGVISTGGQGVMDMGFLRKPFRAWFLTDGEDMERHGCVPDFIVWPHPGDLPAGKDAQLDKAIEVLMKDVAEWKARPQPKRRFASER